MNHFHGNYNESLPIHVMKVLTKEEQEKDDWELFHLDMVIEDKEKSGECHCEESIKRIWLASWERLWSDPEPFKRVMAVARKKAHCQKCFDAVYDPDTVSLVLKDMDAIDEGLAI